MAKFERTRLTLTRYLYILQEVCLSLLISLLYSRKRPFERVIFWLSELYYSGFNDVIWSVLISIYYEYYYIKYPKLENIIIKKKKEFIKESSEDNRIGIILSLFKNIYSKSIDKFDDNNKNYFIRHIVSILARNTDERDAEIQKWHTIFKGRKPKIIQSFCDINSLSSKNKRDKSFIWFIQSIMKKNEKNIYVYYSLFKDETKQNQEWIFDKTLIYFEYIDKERKDKYYINKRKVFEFCDDKDVRLSLFIAVVQDLLYNYIINKQKTRVLFILQNDNEITYFKQTNDITNIKVWNILKE